MRELIVGLQQLYGSVPLPLLEVWGRFAYLIGLMLAACAFTGVTFRPAGAWGLGREQQAWDARALFSAGLTFALIPLSGYIGSGIVLVPGAQTFESLKDVMVFLTIVLFGYPALLVIPAAYMLSDLIEGVPPGFVLDWMPGYFCWTAFVWMAYQLIGRNPDFRLARTWGRYALFVLVLMALDPVMWGYLCSAKFTPAIAHREITPALAFTLSITWLLAPFMMLGALPLARRCRLFWAEIPGHVRERWLRRPSWVWESGQGVTPAPVAATGDEAARGIPIRMVLAASFIGLALLLVGAVAWLTLRNGEEAANKLASRLHQEIADNINLQLDDYLARTSDDVAQRVATINHLLAGLQIARHGRAWMVARDGRVIASSLPGGRNDAVMREAQQTLQRTPLALSSLRVPYQFRFDVVSAQPLSRETWLAQATPYSDPAGHTNWVELTAMPESYYLADVQAGSSQSAMLSAIALTLALLLASLLAGIVAAPIRRISDSTESIAHGDLAQRVQGSHLQELNALADAFNRMAAQLQGSFKQAVASEQTLVAIFDASPVALAVLEARREGGPPLDPRKGRKILNVNHAWERMNGFTREQVLGESSTSLGLWKDDNERTRFSEAVRDGGFVEDFEAVLRRADGSLYTALLSARDVQIGDGYLSILSIEDITEQKLASARLLELNQQLHALFDAAVEVAIIATDPDEYITVFNRGAERMLGYTAAEMLGQPITRFHRSNEIAKCAQELAAHGGVAVDSLRIFAALTRETGSDIRNWSYMRQDGKILRVSLALSAIRTADGSLSGYLGIARDITEQLAAQADTLKLNLQLDNRVRERTRELEASTAQLQHALDNLRHTQDKLVQSEKLASLGSIVAAVAHELNTPIGICVTVASTLQEKTDTLEQQLHAGAIKRSQFEDYLTACGEGVRLLQRGLQRAHELVANFKRVAVDQSSAQRRVFGLQQVMQDVTALLMTSVRKTPFKLEVDVDDRLEMDSFPGALEQIVSNLVNNSLLHGFAGREQGVMRLRAGPDGEQVRLEYSDDGVGMSDDVLHHIFDPFFTTALGKGGSGLGMSICYNLITGPLGGSIEVESTPGHGCRFVIMLPRVAPEHHGGHGPAS
ncbi:PAS domain S-box-containing protein [Andreprevotia lacus DSM 23236]|jgi:PAS domain S-box-containing protein|uniref:histidine kinase n=1 Tax=Andreprevotia lacus DSM 23236 TaxID=1121001 RepID=A0A1W1XGG3_9NEIS|nr:PAS domain S-box protein [Andreprevotia lacus]SMC23073.1 PAS domain S-box-containing protein [Andreprevotia lacus DSM 23236]